MSDNKFIQRLKGANTSKSVLEIKNEAVSTSFAQMPKGTSDGTRTYVDHSGDAIGVLKGAENWKLNGANLIYASSINSDGRDYTSESDNIGGPVVLDGDGMAVSGAGLWIDASYTFAGDPTKTVAIFNAPTKWALKLCGHSLFSSNDLIDFVVLIKIGTATVISKNFTVTKDSFEFCKDLVIDFTEGAQSTIKVLGNQTLRLQLLCSDTTASATIYNGMTVFTALQRRVDMDAIAGGGYSLGDLETELNNIHSELDGKLNLDGTNTMTGPLKMRASISFQCAIAPSWDGVGFYKLNDDDSVTLMASMETTTGFSPFSTNTYDIGTSSKKWKNLYLAGKAFVGTINNGGNIDVPTKAGTMALESDIGRTNCLTQIPQDIKVEIGTGDNAGKLIVKAGTKAYMPTGTAVTVASDIVISPTSSITRMLFLTSTGTSYDYINVNAVYSGATAPTVTGTARWFDTTNYVLKQTTDSGATWTTLDETLPIAVFTTTSGSVTSIDSVFNGFGVIASTIFSLPGIKGLIPNGRNADGTLKNTVLNRTSIAYYTAPDGSNYSNLKFVVTTGGLTGYYLAYDAENNYVYRTDNKSRYYDRVMCGSFDVVNGVIANFKTTPVFHAVDYGDTEFIAHQAMPSSRYVDLTLPATAGTITAGADGYLTINKSATAAGQYINFINGSNGMNCNIIATSALPLRLFMPVSKGDVITINYDAAGTTTMFRFIYVNGSK